MNALRRLIAPATCCALAEILAVGLTEAAEVCKHIHASLQSHVVEAGTTACPIACTAGVVTGDGLLSGTTHFTATGLAPGAGLTTTNPNSTFSDSGTFVLTTNHGTLTTSSIGMFDLANGVFFDIGTVSGGTDRFEGATGTLFFFGSVVQTSGGALALAFEGDIRGEVCLVK
jgi:hypothetical protein